MKIMAVGYSPTIDVSWCHNHDRCRHDGVMLFILIWLLILPLDQNSIMIYHKFNGDFKSHINFGRIKRGQRDDM
jgi:hypothetical protein